MPSCLESAVRTLEFFSAIVIRRSLRLFLRGGDDKKLLGGHHRAVDDFDDAADGKQVKTAIKSFIAINSTSRATKIAQIEAELRDVLRFRTPLIALAVPPQEPQLTARSDSTLLFDPDNAAGAAEDSPGGGGSGSAGARRAGSRLQSMPNVLQNPSASDAAAAAAAASSSAAKTGSDDRSVAKLPSSTSVPQISQLQGRLSLPKAPVHPTIQGNSPELSNL